MPLPSTATQWPPAPLQKAYETYEVFDAWYTSDTEALGYLYAVNRLQKRTSVWGQVSRFFWGTPTPMTTTQRPVKMHVPVAAEVSRMSSQVLFSEMPTVHFGDEDGDDDDKGISKAQGKVITERLVELLGDSAHATLLAAAEYASAHGGVFLRVTWDQDVVPDGPFLTYVAADAAVPEFRWGRLTAVTFWRELAPLEGSDQAYKLLERHEPGTIEWGLYAAGAKEALGNRVPLTEHPDVAHLAGVVNDQASITTGSDLLTAVYIQNAGPNGRWRKDPGASDLGRSDYVGVEDLFDQLDEAYTSWMRDIRLGKARIMIPKGMIQTGPPGQGGVFNADQEIFTELGETVGSLNTNAKTGGSQSFMEEFQPKIRWQEHRETVVHLLARIYQACGFSPQSFGDAGEVAVTATEVNSREKLTVLTRSSKILYWRPQLRNLFAVLLDIDKAVFSGPGRGDGALPDIEWPDSSATDPKVLADTLQALNLAESASIQTRVEMLHDDWDDEQVAAEVQRIRDDYSMLPDPTEKNLWAAVSNEGSSTGGVQTSQSGLKPGVPLTPALQAMKQSTGQESKLNASDPGPQ